MRANEKSDVMQGTLALIMLKTLNVLGPQNGYGIAKRIEQTSGSLRLAANQRDHRPLFRSAIGELRCV
jgi:PadR family transcriptional regulator PadR